MRKRFLGLAMASVLLANACGGSTTSPSTAAGSAAPGGSAAATPEPSAAEGGVVLTLRYCWGGEGEVKAMEKVIQAWNSKNPDIQVKGISGSIQTEQIAAAVAGGAPPDMVIMCDNGAIAGFAHDKVIMQLDPLLDTIQADKSNIIPAALKWVTYQGGLYGLPFGQDTWALYYDTDAFTEVGLDPAKPPKTPDELWDYAAKLTKWNADGTLARAGFIPDDPDRNLDTTTNLFNCSWYDETAKKITVNSPECVAWFNWYKKWYDEYNKKNAMIDLVATRTGGDGGLMANHQLAMAIYGEWMNGAAYFPESAPDLHYETAPIPAINADKYGAAFINGNAFMIPSGTAHPEAAAKFGMYLMTDEPTTTMALQNASVPQLTSLLTNATMTAIPHQKTFLELVNHKDAWVTPMISVYGQLKDGLASALSAVTTGGADPQQALDELATQVQSQLDANGP